MQTVEVLVRREAQGQILLFSTDIAPGGTVVFHNTTKAPLTVTFTDGDPLDPGGPIELPAGKVVPATVRKDAEAGNYPFEASSAASGSQSMAGFLAVASAADGGVGKIGFAFEDGGQVVLRIFLRKGEPTRLVVDKQYQGAQGLMVKSRAAELFGLALEPKAGPILPILVPTDEVGLAARLTAGRAPAADPDAGQGEENRAVGLLQSGGTTEIELIIDP